MRIKIGANPNDDFHIYDNDGNEITDKLDVKDLYILVDSKNHTRVHMTCYADSVEVLTDQVDVTIIGNDA